MIFQFLVGKLCRDISNGSLAAILKPYVRFFMFCCVSFFLFFFFFLFSTLTVTQISTQNSFGKVCFRGWVHTDPTLPYPTTGVHIFIVNNKMRIWFEVQFLHKNISDLFFLKMIRYPISFDKQFLRKRMFIMF